MKEVFLIEVHHSVLGFKAFYNGETKAGEPLYTARGYDALPFTTYMTAQTKVEQLIKAESKINMGEVIMFGIVKYFQDKDVTEDTERYGQGVNLQLYLAQHGNHD